MRQSSDTKHHLYIYIYISIRFQYHNRYLLPTTLTIPTVIAPRVRLYDEFQIKSNRKSKSFMPVFKCLKCVRGLARLRNEETTSKTQSQKRNT